MVETVRSTPCFSLACSTAFCRTSSSVSPVTFALQTTPASAHLKLLVNLSSGPIQTDLPSPLHGYMYDTQSCAVRDEERRWQTKQENERSEDPEGAPRGRGLRRAGAAWHRGLGGSDDGPLTEVHVFWLAGMSCDGCSIAVTGATSPSVEELLAGTIPGLPKVVLHHPVLSVAAGAEFVRPLRDAADGTLGAPYVVVLEGSVPDDQALPEDEGYYSGDGRRRVRSLTAEGGPAELGSPTGSRGSGPGRRGLPSRSAPARPGAGSPPPPETSPAR